MPKSGFVVEYCRRPGDGRPGMKGGRARVSVSALCALAILSLQGKKESAKASVEGYLISTRFELLSEFSWFSSVVSVGGRPMLALSLSAKC